MEGLRKPFQGVINIVRFNRHFYILFFLLLIIPGFAWNILNLPFLNAFVILSMLAALSVTISLLVSYYIYDLSGLYGLNWLNDLKIPRGGKILNVHAGFDETSSLLSQKYPENELLVFDFYNPQTHTEVSVKRARRAYPPYKGTVTVDCRHLPLNDESISVVFVIFSAHEIRQSHERIEFFKELKRILEPGGKIVIAEHLRDWPNALAYTLGVFHFYSQREWIKTFLGAGLQVFYQSRINPFVKLYILN